MDSDETNPNNYNNDLHGANGGMGNENDFVLTTSRNYKGFTKCQVFCAIQAQLMQAMTGSQSACDFTNLVCFNIIENCPIKDDNLNNADTMFGPDLAGLRGKMIDV